MLDRIFGMTIEVNRYLPRDSIIVVSPDVYSALMMDPKVHPYYGTYEPARFLHSPDGGVTLEQHTQESLAEKYKATDLLMAFRKMGAAAERAAIETEALRWAWEQDYKQRKLQEAERARQRDWRENWWHEGHEKAWWES